jgi:glutamate carboxypeptidase
VIDKLEALVNAESPTSQPALCAKAGRVLFDIIDREPDEIVEEGGREHYLWHWPGDRPVLLIGHLDTVWPSGTTMRWPFQTDGARATGPGVYDMKGGLVVAAEALRLLEERGSLHSVTLLVNSDEEIGSITSRALIEREAEGARAALILEGGLGDGRVKVARKGVGMYAIDVAGRAAHAGLEPQKGINALVEAAHQVVRAAALGDSSNGTSVTPTVASAGTARNVVPAKARVDIDVRVTSDEESARVDAAMQSLTAVLDGAVVTISGGPNRPPMQRRMAERLYGVAKAVAADLGFDVGAAEVGGGSDGNFTAAMGIETLDGLGAAGGKAHAEGEWIDLTSIPKRASLVAGIVERLLAEETALPPRS